MSSALIFISLLSVSSLFSISASTFNSNGFSSPVIHTNSPKSPFHNPNLKTSDLMKAAVHQSYARAHYLQALQSNTIIPNDTTTRAWPEMSEYTMEYYIGKPNPVQAYGVIDTANHLTWLQCLPCDGCPSQSTPLFDPSKSSTFYPLSCSEITCKYEPSNECSDDDVCEYYVHYEDNSFSSGVLAYETLLFRDSTKSQSGNFTWNNVVIGCGHYNFENIPGQAVPAGLIGLNLSPLSLVQQSPVKRFAYCFADREDPRVEGYIKFGEAAFLNGDHTPIENIHSKIRFYYLILEGISVGNTRLDIPHDAFNFKYETGRGGFIIDSRTTYTLLNETAFNILAGEVDKILSTTTSRVLYHSANPFTDCFKGNASDFEEGPVITLHFTGMDLRLPTWNTWVKVSDDVYCLGFLPTREQSILGNYQQLKIEVGIDVEHSLLYLNPVASCSD